MPWHDWIRTVEVEPSVYAADFSRLGDQLDVLLRTGARVFHYDVGDGRFVPPITIGPIVLKDVAPAIHDAGGVVDVHLMTVSPEQPLRRAGRGRRGQRHGAPGGVPGARRAWCARARELELEVGLAFKPETEVEAAVEAAHEHDVDLVLCMSIEPGLLGAAVHAGGASRGSRSCGGCCGPRSTSRSTAGSGRRRSAERTTRAPTCSSRARRSSGARTCRARTGGSSRRWHERTSSARSSSPSAGG